MRARGTKWSEGKEETTSDDKIKCDKNDKEKKTKKADKSKPVDTSDTAELKLRQSPAKLIAVSDRSYLYLRQCLLYDIATQRKF